MRPQTIDRWLLAFVVAGGAALTWLALVEAPSFVGRENVTGGLTYKLFFFHVPLAFVGFAAFGLAFYHSLFHLVRARPERDRGAQSAVETGFVASILALATGLVWGEAEWGVPFKWDEAKLVLVLFMVLVYAAYLLVRREIEDADRRARVAAVYAVAAFATVPLVWFAQNLWERGVHPEVFGAQAPDAGVVTPGVLPLFLFALAVLLGVFGYFYRWRLRLLRVRDDLEDRTTAEVVA